MWRIDISEVPSEKRTDPRFLELCKRIQNSDPRQIKAVCVHEAAHGIYLRRAGAIDLRRRGTLVGYDVQHDDFFISPAAVAPIFPTPWNARLDEVARYHAAGGVAMRTLTAETDVGDEKDLESLREFCNDFFPAQTANVHHHWQRAQSEVERDLRNPKFKQEVWEQARDFENWLRDYSK